MLGVEDKGDVLSLTVLKVVARDRNALSRMLVIK